MLRTYERHLLMVLILKMQNPREKQKKKQ